jgi:hypothetical protein
MEPLRSIRNDDVFEAHYTVAEIAEWWNLSTDFVRRLFRKEEGVLLMPSRNAHPGKRARYTSMRIPAGVVERVRRRYAICKN